jgi:hypothetical protein
MARRVVFFFMCACLALFAPAAYSQEIRASISGIVEDPSGAPIVGAKVVVTNVATGVVVATESNQTGNYLTPFLQPGVYTLSVESSGFKRFVQTNIVLQTLDKLRVDVQLQIGQLADSVTVTAEVATLQTETASRSQIISNEMIANIPTQGRNPFQIMWAAPGVFKSGGWRYLRSFDIAGTTGFSANGGRSAENEVLMDGISNVQSNRNVIHVPTMDSVQEFKVLTNTYDAQYGRTGGGIVTIVSKSGSNDFHGSLYEYFQNDKLNANQFELNAAGIKKSPNHINAFGFQLSGPVFVPKVFNGRNKLFWTIAYEGMRQRSADPAIATVPIPEIRGGDFTSLFSGQGQQVLIYDPLTTTADGSRQPFAGNKLPANRINPVAVAALKFYPGPTSAGVGPSHSLNYPFPSRWIGNLDQWTGRMDYNINSKNTMYFRYGQNPYSEFRSLVFVTDPSQSNPAEPTGNAPLIRNGRNIMGNWTSTISPRMTFDLRAGLSRWEETTGNIFGTSFDQKDLGIAPSLISQFTRNGFPQLNFSGYQSFGPGRLISYSANDTYTVQPNVSMVVGSHFMKFGVEMRKYNDNNLNPGLAVGSYSFDKTWTQARAKTPDAVSGNELASYLLGYPQSAYVDRNIDPAYVHFYYATFFQDDWKITPRLTLNLGLRWDYESPATERYDRMVRGLDLNAASPIASKVTGLNLKGAVLFANLNGQPRGAFNPDKNNIAPRVGVAYRLGSKWVLRGGYGLYYLGQSATGSNQGYSQRTNATVSLDGGLTPAVNLTNAFALQAGGQLLAAVGNSQGAGSFLGQSMPANYLDRALPRSHQYSFDIQRELPGNVLLEAGYVGNQTRGLPLNFGLNYLPVSELGRKTAAGLVDTAYYTAQLPNPMAGLIPANAALNGATATRQALILAYPQFSGPNLNNVPMGRQRYDSLQIKVTRRFAQGLTVLASYTLAKTLEQVSLLSAQDLIVSDPTSSKLVKQPADQIDIPQKFNIAGVWELPVGKGKKVAGNVSNPVNQFIGGWDLNWNITYMRGPAIAYPNAPQVAAGSAKLDNPSIGQWFNTSLWIDPATGKYVAPPNLTYNLRTFPIRFSDVRLPGYRNWDISLSKYFPIHERLRAQFKLEAVNLMNHPWFTGIASVDVSAGAFGVLNTSQNNLPRFLKLGLILQW